NRPAIWRRAALRDRGQTAPANRSRRVRRSSEWTSTSASGRVADLIGGGGFDSGDPACNRASDRLRMVLLQIMQARAELDHRDVAQSGGKLPCKGRRSQRAGIADEQQLGIA